MATRTRFEIAVGISCKTSLEQCGDFANSLFMLTNQLLMDPEYSCFLEDMNDTLACKYADGLDFIVCEVFGVSLRRDCALYYSGEGRPLREFNSSHDKYIELLDRTLVQLIRDGKKVWDVRFRGNIDNHAGILEKWRRQVKTQNEYASRPIP